MKKTDVILLNMITNEAAGDVKKFWSVVNEVAVRL